MDLNPLMYGTKMRSRIAQTSWPVEHSRYGVVPLQNTQTGLNPTP